MQISIQRFEATPFSRNVGSRWRVRRGPMRQRMSDQSFALSIWFCIAHDCVSFLRSWRTLVDAMVTALAISTSVYKFLILLKIINLVHHLDAREPHRQSDVLEMLHDGPLLAIGDTGCVGDNSHVSSRSLTLVKAGFCPFPLL